MSKVKNTKYTKNIKSTRGAKSVSSKVIPQQSTKIITSAEKQRNQEELNLYRIITTACLNIISEYGNAYFNHVDCRHLEKQSVKKLVEFVDSRLKDIANYQLKNGMPVETINKWKDYNNKQSYFLSEVIAISSALAFDDEVRNNFIINLENTISMTNTEYTKKLNNLDIKSSVSNED